MLCEGNCLEAKTNLHVFRRPSLNAKTYIPDIPEEYAASFAQFIDPHFLFMHDNAQSHAANAVRDYLDEIRVRTMDWPATGPELNPIKHLWDHLKKSIRQQNNPPRAMEPYTSR